MSFSSFSKDFSDNSFTSIENKFITKYLPEASGDAVRVYLYGLYLCGKSQEFDADTVAKLLKITPKAFAEIYAFWEECGLVQILSRDPLFVEYLPVNAAVGKPKPLRPEKYTQFNRELFKLLQRAGKDLKPYEQQRVLEYLENSSMEQQAFLLIVEYYVKKEAEKFNINHVLNKAKALERNQKYTYDQVEEEFADFHKHVEELAHIFSLMSIYRKPQDADYDLLETYRNAGVEPGAVYACAESIGKGSMASLDRLVSELIAHKIFTEKTAREYLERRENSVQIVFRVAKKLGVKVQDPRPYLEEYVEKWTGRGYDGEGLTRVAAYGLRLGFGFQELDALLDSLYARNIITEEQIKDYCSARERDLKFLQSVQSVVGVVKKSETVLDMVAEWRKSFSDEMISEAAKRAANASAPLAYMNKLLTDWKTAGAFRVSEIPEKETAAIRTVRSEAAIAADERTERERYYAERRDIAMRRVARAEAIAARDEEYAEASSELRSLELERAKAELFGKDDLAPLLEKIEAAKSKQQSALVRLHLSERDFRPVFLCAKCSDTGFLPDGRPCDCYKK